ncbi:hypothetical protein LCGC14_2553520 [marine sediment metagenome]|uniref:Uncharacterized protein n=1 Tax=marine sediment metagenome TaxID=412755 RepID=A0A0F9BA33_9ZZZZ
MFYEWFLWNLEYLDTRPPMSKWPINDWTKEIFIEVYARILKD